MDINKTIKETAKERQQEFAELYGHIDVLERNIREFKNRVKYVCDAEPDTYVARGMVAHDVRDFGCQVQRIMEIVGRIENKNFALELLIDMQEQSSYNNVKG